MLNKVLSKRFDLLNLKNLKESKLNLKKFGEN